MLTTALMIVAFMLGWLAMAAGANYNQSNSPTMYWLGLVFVGLSITVAYLAGQ